MGFRFVDDPVSAEEAKLTPGGYFLKDELGNELYTNPQTGGGIGVTDDPTKRYMKRLGATSLVTEPNAVKATATIGGQDQRVDSFDTWLQKQPQQAVRAPNPYLDVMPPSQPIDTRNISATPPEPGVVRAGRAPFITKAGTASLYSDIKSWMDTPAMVSKKLGDGKYKIGQYEFNPSLNEAMIGFVGMSQPLSKIVGMPWWHGVKSKFPPGQTIVNDPLALKPMTPRLALARLNQAGVAKAEMEAMGLPQWLEKTGNASPMQIAQFVEENKGKTEVGEVVRQEFKPTDTTPKPVTHVNANEYTEMLSEAPKFQRYTHPGGKNYREISLTLPEAKVKPSDQHLKEIQKRGTELEAYIQQYQWLKNYPQLYGELWTPEHEAQLAGFQKERLALAEEGKKLTPSLFDGAHSEIPNELAIIRMSDRTLPSGEKASLLDETQSDWALSLRQQQQLAEAPIQMGDVRDLEIIAERRSYPADVVLGIENVKTFVNELDNMGEARIELELLRKRVGSIMPGDELVFTIDQILKPSKAPKIEAPSLVDKWHDLAFKRAIFDAVQKGHTRLMWSTGQQIADRYDLSKHLDSVSYSPREQRLDMVLKDGGTDTVSDPVPPEKLADYVGKEVAKRLLETKPKIHHTGDVNPRMVHYLENLDLKVGGEWAKRLYDENFGNKAKKLTNMFGGKIEDVDMGYKGDLIKKFHERFEADYDMDDPVFTELEHLINEGVFRDKASLDETMMRLKQNVPDIDEDTLKTFKRDLEDIFTDYVPPGAAITPLGSFHSLVFSPDLIEAVKAQGFHPYQDWEKVEPQSVLPAAKPQTLPEQATSLNADPPVKYVGEQMGYPMFQQEPPGVGSFMLKPGETLEEAFKRAQERYKGVTAINKYNDLLPPKND